MEKLRAWSLLTVDHAELQYGGNGGYDDDPTREYRYDSEVGNHKQVRTGDLVVLRTKKAVLGIAEVESVTSRSSSKFRQRCPNCRVTTLKARRIKTPRWRCHGCGSEFDSPLEEQFPVTEYSATYAESFIGNTSGVTLDQIRAIVLRPSGQMSISELDLARLEKLFSSSTGGAGDLFSRVVLRISVTPTEGANGLDAQEEPGSYERSAVDSRRQVLRAILERRGQEGFRRRLIERYGARCAVSGCELLAVLEAAHIDPYRNASHNHPENGILLRADLHTLFDLGLLAIYPHKWIVHIHRDALQTAAYSDLDGKTLEWGGLRPSTEALAHRWQVFESTLSLRDNRLYRKSEEEECSSLRMAT